MYEINILTILKNLNSYHSYIQTLRWTYSALQRLVTVCGSILQSLDLAINIKKSVCTRIGPRCNAPCANIVTSDGKSLQWVDSIRYLGVFITRHRNFKCSLHHAKQSFYRSFNAIYGKIGRTASEEVTLSLI